MDITKENSILKTIYDDFYSSNYDLKHYLYAVLDAFELNSFTLFNYILEKEDCDAKALIM